MNPRNIGKISGNRCRYYNCGLTKRKDPHLRMFRFPKNAELAKQWILNCGVVELYKLSTQSLRNNYICINHFEDTAFTDVTKKRLKQKNAVPKPWDALNDVQKNESTLKPPLRTYENRKNLKISLNEHNYCVQSPSALEVLNNSDVQQKASNPLLERVMVFNTTNKEQLTHTTQGTQTVGTYMFELQCKKLKEKYQNLQKLSKNRQTTITKLRHRVQQLKRVTKADVIQTIDYPSRSSKALACMQALHKDKRPWTDDEMKLSLRIFSRSPQTYRYLRNVENIILPGVSTIKRWMQTSTGLPFCKIPMFQFERELATEEEEEEYIYINVTEDQNLL